MSQLQGRASIPQESRYEESVSSYRTQALFWTLTAAFFLLFVMRTVATGWNVLALAMLLASVFFLFYSLNYRSLVIRLVRREWKTMEGS